jgi:hypothetical protein
MASRGLLAPFASIVGAIGMLLAATWPAAASAFDAVLCADYDQRTVVDETTPGAEVVAVRPEERAQHALRCLHLLRNRLDQVAGGTASEQAQAELDALEERISDVEEDLRGIAKYLARRVSERRYYDEQKLAWEWQLVNIENYFNIPPYARLYVDNNDYDRYSFKVSIGYEYTSIRDVLAVGAARIGLLIHHHYGRMPYSDEYGFDLYGAQLSGNLLLSGSTEQKSNGDSDEETDSETLGMDVALFAPLLRNRVRADVALLTGPLFVVGASQTDLSTRIRTKTYAGVRSGINPEHYIDVLVGRSPGLSSTRVEIRGQMPVARMQSGNAFFIGTVINMGAINDEPDEEDRITIYVSWNIDFLDLFMPGS